MSWRNLETIEIWYSQDQVKFKLGRGPNVGRENFLKLIWTGQISDMYKTADYHGSQVNEVIRLVILNQNDKNLDYNFIIITIKL